ncbi:MAG: LysR family transcriptional regulator [Rubrivivax sp.]|nr:LysR family transcriptional regulator [Rubrivivax sp.]
MGPAAAALDANALELFARIVAAGSFAQAARELHLTRAAVSRRVAVLEEQLGVPLFARTTRALGLTEAGRRLSARARAVAEAAEAARRGFRRGASADAGLVGTLRITTFPAFAEAVLAPLLARFQTRHPALRLELRLTNRPVDLLRDDVDIAFRLTDKPPPDWVATPMLTMTARAYAAPRRSGLPLAHPRDLAREPCLLFGPPTEQATMSWQHEADEATLAVVTLEPVLVADGLAMLVAAARHGRGVAFLPDFMAAPLLAAGQLVDVLPGWRLHVTGGRTVQALTAPLPEASAAARELVRWIRAELEPAGRR